MTAALCSCVCLVSVAQEVAAYRDAELSVEERVTDLMGRMVTSRICFMPLGQSISIESIFFVKSRPK